MSGPLRIKKVEAIPLYRLQIVWSDKRRREHDLRDIIWKYNIFSPLRHNLALFREVKIGEWGECVYWGEDDMSLSADTLLLPVNSTDMELLTNAEFYKE